MNTTNTTKATEFETLWAAYVTLWGKAEDIWADPRWKTGFGTSGARKGTGLRLGKARQALRSARKALLDWCQANNETPPSCALETA